MGFFSKKKEGGLMDVIRCDESEYLIWKWRPSGAANSTNKENAIRFGSSLRVKDGEMAVFVYATGGGQKQDYIVGPHDQMIQTANFPVLSSIVGTAFGGSSPFQAEVYFINLAGNVQIKFGVPYFDVFDPRFLDFGVPMSVRGTITFNITAYREFIKLNRLVNFELQAFEKQIRDAVAKYVKAVVSNLPSEKGIPVVQIERKILEINDYIADYIRPRLENDFGVNLKALDISAIEIDKEAPAYEELRKVTAEQTMKTTVAQTDVNVKNMQDMQAINADNMSETLRIQREEAQRIQQLQTETNFIGTHALNQQAEVMKAGAESLGNMGNMGSGGGINPAGMVTGMMMGRVMGNQMAGMMNQMGQNLSQQQPNVPPPPPQIQYSISINGQTSGPYNWQQLQQMVQSGQLNKDTYVWKQGMAQWELAGNVQELNALFASVPPPPPPPPPVG